MSGSVKLVIALASETLQNKKQKFKQVRLIGSAVAYPSTFLQKKFIEDFYSPRLVMGSIVSILIFWIQTVAR